ncbi:hypothetical protein AAC387_Pa02g2219 [Persea americana]
MGSTSLQAHNQWKIFEEGLNSNIAAKSNQSFSNIHKTGKGLNIAASFRIQNLQSSLENPRKTKKGLDIAASSKSQNLRKDFQGVVGPLAVSRRLADLRKKFEKYCSPARPSCLIPLFWCLDAGAVVIAEERSEEAFEPLPAREWQPDDVL